MAVENIRGLNGSIIVNEELEKLWMDAVVTCCNMLLHSLLETLEGHGSMSADN